MSALAFWPRLLLQRVIQGAQGMTAWPERWEGSSGVRGGAQAARPSIRQSKQLQDPWAWRERDVCIPCVLLSPRSLCRLSRACIAMSPSPCWACPAARSCKTWPSPSLLHEGGWFKALTVARQTLKGASGSEWQGLRRQELASPAGKNPVTPQRPWPVWRAGQLPQGTNAPSPPSKWGSDTPGV